MSRKIIGKRTVGLLGGSFNPPHAGHLHISNQAITSLGLKEVWWIVSPRNPLKEDYTHNYKKRLDACKKFLQGTKIKITEVERFSKSHYSCDTIRALRKKFPRIRFVWLIGADNMHFFHYWKNWGNIFLEIPIAVFSRPDQQLKAGLSLAAQTYAKFRVNPKTLMKAELPAWSLQIGPQINISSTKLRTES